MNRIYPNDTCSIPRCRKRPTTIVMKSGKWIRLCRRHQARAPKATT